MGDVGDDYRCLKERIKADKQARYLRAMEEILPLGWQKHGPHHWFVHIGPNKVDYWPTTGKYQYKQRVYHEREFGDVTKFVRREQEKYMSNDFDNTNSGALFKNDKRGNERSPEYKGECAPVCPHCGKKSEFWLSAWIKIMKKDATKKFMSLALTPKDEPKNQSQQNYDAPPADFDDDIPF